MAEAGADLIEIGTLFQTRSRRGRSFRRQISGRWPAALRRIKFLTWCQSVRKSCQVPLAFMTYMNPVYTYGVERFMARCQAAGIDALIVPDVPYEKKQSWRRPAGRLMWSDLDGGADL